MALPDANAAKRTLSLNTPGAAAWWSLALKSAAALGLRLQTGSDCLQSTVPPTSHRSCTRFLPMCAHSSLCPPADTGCVETSAGFAPASRSSSFVHRTVVRWRKKARKNATCRKVANIDTTRSQISNADASQAGLLPHRHSQNTRAHFNWPQLKRLACRKLGSCSARGCNPS